jgi:hypothetical protein
MVSAINPIDLLIDKLHGSFKADPRLERSMQFDLEKLVRMTYQDSISQKGGWCMRLKVPHVDVVNLYKKLNIDESLLKSMILSHFNIPGNPHMWGNPYYHILLILTLYGVKFGNDSIANSSMSLIFFKLWNGRRSKYIPYCDPDTMKYVVANLSRRSLFKKYDSPITLIMNYFTPTLLKTYADKMRVNSDVIKRLFDQAFTRLRQLFIQDMAPDILSGKNRARSGIAALYFDAKSKGYKLSSSRVNNADDDVNVVDLYSSGTFDELIDSVTNYIIMNTDLKYPSDLIKFINDQSHVNENVITLLLSGLHAVQYQKYIHEILGLFLQQLQINDKFDVCVANFLSHDVKQRIIASKHSPLVTQFKALIGELTEKIFNEKVQYVKYSSYSNPIRGQLRKVIIYGIAYEVQTYICSKVQRF